jgi:hypothetical protein
MREMPFPGNGVDMIKYGIWNVLTNRWCAPSSWFDNPYVLRRAEAYKKLEEYRREWPDCVYELRHGEAIAVDVGAICTCVSTREYEGGYGMRTIRHDRSDCPIHGKA